jgi:phosphatidate cytidylyltransferase
MLTRIFTALLGIIAAVLLITYGGFVFSVAVFLIATLAWYEYARMMYRIAPVYSKPAVCALAFIMLAASTSESEVFLASLLISFILLTFMILVIPKKEMQSLFYTLVGVMYFGMGFGSLLVLRGADNLLAVNDVSIHAGVFLLWFALLGTWGSDTFAYFTGRFFGIHKMAPHISPKKTMEGLLGGMAGTLLLCMLFSWYFDFSLAFAFVLGLMVAIAAPMGDLFESYVKRVCDIKDSGNILPGHGGMMDRFDSLLFVAPLLLATLSILRWF